MSEKRKGQRKSYTLPVETVVRGIIRPAGTKVELFPDQIDRLEAHAKAVLSGEPTQQEVTSDV